MNAKKRLLVLLVAVMVLSLANISAFAGDFSDDVPSSATVYGAETCHYGFTTSRTISRGSGWNSTIHVSCTYALWDDIWEYDMHELVQVRDDTGNTSLSEQTVVYTGLYNPGAGELTVNPGTNRSDYTPFIETISLYSTASNYSQLKLRITKPSDPNHANGADSIYNMKVWGYFWK